VRIRNNLSLTGGLLVLCVAGYYWGGLSKDAPLSTTDSTNVPDYEITQITGIQVNEQGSPERTLTANTLVHYNQRDESIIQQPVITLYQHDQATWQLSAQQATLLKNNHQINLQQDVLAKRINSVPLQLTTQSLTANQETHILQSHSPVVVSTTQGQISSLGLEANTEAGLLQFTGQVRGTYVLSPR
jgi:lipopolysaccharide export system protein LptC